MTFVCDHQGMIYWDNQNCDQNFDDTFRSLPLSIFSALFLVDVFHIILWQSWHISTTKLYLVEKKKIRGTSINLSADLHSSFPKQTGHRFKTLSFICVRSSVWMLRGKLREKKENLQSNQTKRICFSKIDRVTTNNDDSEEFRKISCSINDIGHFILFAGHFLVRLTSEYKVIHSVSPFNWNNFRLVHE